MLFTIVKDLNKTSKLCQCLMLPNFNMAVDNFDAKCLGLVG